LLAFIKDSNPAFASPPATYAATIRGRKLDRKPAIETWAYALAVGEPLPTLPLWLSEDLVVPLELEASYEDACRVLRIA
jgi:hypothetical protein